MTARDRLEGIAAALALLVLIGLGCFVLSVILPYDALVPTPPR